jgi:hypothetical protein
MLSNRLSNRENELYSNIPGNSRAAFYDNVDLFVDELYIIIFKFYDIHNIRQPLQQFEPQTIPGF